MAGYWKIEKEWVQEWGLSGNEALMLADIIDRQDVTLEKRGSRVGMTKKGALNVIQRLKSNLQVTEVLGVKNTPNDGVKNTPNAVKKLHQARCKNYTENGVKITLPPTPPYIEEQESLTNVSETRAREEENSAKKREQELALGGTIFDIKTLAEECKEETLGGGSFAASAIRLYGKYGLTSERLLAYLDEFVDKLTLEGKTLTSRRDFRNHFSSWLRIQVTTNNTNQTRYNGTTRQQGTLGTGAVTRPANDRTVSDF